MNDNYNNINNNYPNNKKSGGSPLTGIISILLIGAIIFVGLITFNVIDNPFKFLNSNEIKEINLTTKSLI